MLGAGYFLRKYAKLFSGPEPVALLIVIVIVVAGVTVAAGPGNDLSVDELKARVATANIGERPHLCVQIAQKQLVEADKEYAASDVEKGNSALTDVVAYSELARDYAIQSHKYQKQTEIAVRQMARKLGETMHALSRDDQPPVRDAIGRLQRVRDDLLLAMFPKGAK
jgi:hypothetical protein